MRRLKLLPAALATLAMVASTVVQAQPRDYRGPGGPGGPRHDQRSDQRPDQRHDRYGRDDHRGPPGRVRQAPPPVVVRPAPPVVVQPAPVYRPGHRWVRGDRLPPGYRTHHYRVDDWRTHRLRPPPPGYYWMQSGADYLLVAIATGIIAQVILGQ